MQSEKEKLVQFYNAINDYAKKQRLRILYETEAQNAAELVRAESEALSDAYRMIQRETAEMRASITKELSSHEYEGRRALFERRVEIEKKVFDEAADRLAAYTATPDYKKYLYKAVLAAAKTFSASPSGAVFRIREEDMSFAESIRSAYGSECTIEPDSTIQLGGLRALNEGLGIAIDATLDARLEQQHEWFCENADLSID